MERGIVVDDYIRTNVPGIYSVGECAQHRGIAYGLVAPLYEQGAVLAKSLAGVPVEGYAGSVTSTKLKVSDVDVFAVVTGSRCGEADAPARWDLLAQGADTLAIYMGVSRLEEISGELIRHGRDASTPATLIENATTEAERVITGTLGSIARLAVAMKVGNPAMLLIGDPVGVREMLRPSEWENRHIV